MSATTTASDPREETRSARVAWPRRAECRRRADGGMGGIEATGGGEPQAAPQPHRRYHDDCHVEFDRVAVPFPTPAAPPPDLPPDVSNETFSCPVGEVRMHVRDIWSSKMNPTMNTMSAPPLSVIVINPTGSYVQYGARQDTANCSWYSVCIPNTITTIQIKPVGPDGCPSGNPSGAFDISKLAPTSPDIWLDYTGPSSTLAADYSAYPNATVGNQHFRLTNDKTVVASEACPQGQPDQSVPSGYIKVHPMPLSGCAGTCGDEGDRIGRRRVRPCRLPRILRKRGPALREPPVLPIVVSSTEYRARQFGHATLVFATEVFSNPPNGSPSSQTSGIYFQETPTISCT